MTRRGTHPRSEAAYDPGWVAVPLGCSKNATRLTCPFGLDWELLGDTSLEAAESSPCFVALVSSAPSSRRERKAWPSPDPSDCRAFPGALAL